MSSMKNTVEQTSSPPVSKSRSLFITRKSLFLSALLTITILVAIVSIALFSFASIQKTHAAPTDNLPVVGINYTNLDGFADAMKQSRPHWDSYGTLDGAASVDANGWPTTDASILVWEGRSNNQGTYTLTFNGQADISVSFNYATITSKSYDAGSNTTTAILVVTDTGAENFQLNFSNTVRSPGSGTNTGVTNVRMMRPTSVGASTSYSPSTIWTTEFKNAISNYAYIRFMAGTNWNTSVSWSDRTKPNDSSQKKVLPGESNFEGNLIAFEYEVDLCNETGKDCYINIPQKANDDYVTKLAQLIKYGSDGVNPYTSPQSNPVFAPLQGDLKAYIEYSNEVWNFGFQQAHDVSDAAQAEVNAGGSNLNYDGEDNSIALAMRYYARRVVQISSLFRNVFGDEMISRVRPLLEWQYNNLNGTAADMLDFVNNYYNNLDGQHVSDPHPITYYVWGGGGAVYYGSNNDAATTVDAIYASGLPVSNYDGQHTYQQALAIESAWAHAYGLHFVAYEGGFAVGGDGPTAVDTQARWDPRAKQSMLDSFNVFAQAGGDLYTAGTYAQWDDINQANTYPLVQAAHDINNGTYTPGAVTLGTQVSSSGTTITASNYDTRSDAYKGSMPVTDNVGRSAGYIVRVDAAGTYTISLNVANASDGGKLAVLVDGNLLSTISVPNTGSTSSYQNVAAGSVALSTGLHSVLVVASQRANGATAGNLGSVQFGSGGTVNTPPPTSTATATSTPTATPPPTGNTTYVSDLNWTSATTGYGSVQKDKSINGNTITLNGTTYSKGLGVHAISEIHYALNGAYSTFTSDVGVDDESWGGSVQFQVYGDGVKLFDSGIVHKGDTIQHISVNVSGVQDLELYVGDGGDGISNDHADWAGAALQ